MLAEALLLGAQVLRSAHAHHAHADHNHIAFVGVVARERPLQRERIVGIAHGDHDAARAQGRRLAAHRVLVLELEVIFHLPRSELVQAKIAALGDGKDDEECGCERNSALSGDGLGEQVHRGCSQQHKEYREQADRNLDLADVKIRGNLPAALAVVFIAQHQHGQAVKGERPDDAEGIRFTQHDHVAAAHDDGEHLEDEDEIDDAMSWCRIWRAACGTSR